MDKEQAEASQNKTCLAFWRLFSVNKTIILRGLSRATTDWRWIKNNPKVSK